jgi:polyhydroxyalkanoate synthase
MTATVPTPTSEQRPRSASRAPDQPVPIDQDEAVDAVEGGEPVGIPSVASMLRGVASAFAQPGPVTHGAGRLLRDWVAIARGTDEHRPAPRDKRFADPAWSDNPVYRRLAQGYLALGSQLGRLVDEYEVDAEDWHDAERARFAVTLLTSALSPTNTLPGNPAALKRAFDTGGRSLARGLRQFTHDVRHNGVPSSSARTSPSRRATSSTGTTWQSSSSTAPARLSCGSARS